MACFFDLINIFKFFAVLEHDFSLFALLLDFMEL